MNREILLIAEQLKEVYEADPWFGRSVNAILSEIDESFVFEKPNNQHSILELLWHMITWKEFTVSRLRNENDKSLGYFEDMDWRNLDHSDKTLWQQGLHRFAELHNELVEVIQQQKDEMLSKKINEIG